MIYFIPKECIHFSDIFHISWPKSCYLLNLAHGFSIISAYLGSNSIYLSVNLKQYWYYETKESKVFVKLSITISFLYDIICQLINIRSILLFRLYSLYPLSFRNFHPHRWYPPPKQILDWPSSNLSVYLYMNIFFPVFPL